MSTRRYLVTGGAGFIGSHLAEALLNQGESVRVFDNLSTGRSSNLEALQGHPGHFEFVQGDLSDRDAVRAAIEDVEVVFHQGARASVPSSIAEPELSLETNITGTHNVLLAAKDAGVKRVVYASSSSVYGNTLVLPTHEEVAIAPLSPYAVHKLTGEWLCRVFTQIYGLETVALRYFNVFGPRQDPASEYAAVIPRFLTRLMEKRLPIVYGDGEQTRDFTFIENVVQANLLAATSSAAVGTVMNIGCGERISLNTVLQIVGELLGIRVNAEYRDPRPGDVRNSFADISKARQLLEYEPKVNFREGLARTIATMPD